MLNIYLFTCPRPSDTPQHARKTKRNKLKTYPIFLFVFFSLLHSVAMAQHKAEVLHWWVSGGERAALEVIIDAFESQGNQWIDTAVESSYHVKTAAISRINHQKAPTAVQWHTGVSLTEMFNEGYFRELTDLADTNQWWNVLPTAIRDSISVDGKFAAIPITLHSSNWLWANKKILDEVGIAVPTSWKELLEAAPKIARAGYIPLAIGGQPWQQRALFLPIVFGTAGPQLYEQALVHHNPEALASPEMADAFAVFAELRQHIDPQSPDRSWSDTTKLVIDGKAAFQIMGDWAKGEFIQAGMTPGEEFICAPSPGSSGLLLLVSDAFAMVSTTDPEVRASQVELAKTMMDKDVQKAMNLYKGSIPPRTDIAIDEFDTCSQLAYKTASREGTTYPGFSMANTGIVGSAIMSAISSFWNDPNMSPSDGAQKLAEAVLKAKRETSSSSLY